MTNDNESSNKDVAKPDWNGEERRKQVRRSGIDPRGMIRFEPDKNDRRSGKDRRNKHKSGWDSGTTI